MESFGQQFISAREERGITIEQASRETNITKRYLEALENEDFTIFPGEPYLVGFLCNYADYLGLSSEKLVKQYKNIQIQEAPVPLQELTRHTRSPVIPIICTISALVVIGIALFFIIPLFQVEKTSQNSVVQNEPEKQTYTLSEEALNRRFYIGDIISIPLGNEIYSLEIIATSPSVALATEHGNQIIDLGEEISLDLTSTGSSDIRIFVSDLSKTNPSLGAEIRFTYAVKPSDGKDATDLQSIQTVSAASQGKQTVIFDSANPYPITLNVVFRGSCLFRYLADKKTRLEDYFESGDTLVAQANNGFTLWYSNANAVKVQIIGGGRTVDLEMGRPGQVLVQDIKWIKDDDNRYKLVVVEVD